MTRVLMMVTVSLTVLGTVTADAALAKKPAKPAPSAAPVVQASKMPFPMAANGTTNIADCAKVDMWFKNECISRSRPIPGKQLYAQIAAAKAAKAAELKKATLAAAKAEKQAKAAKVAAASGKVTVDVPKGFKVAKDGTTNVADCAKAAPAARNECISRARPLTGKELAKFVSQRQASLEPRRTAKRAVR